MQKSAITGFFSVISVFGLLQFFFQDNLIAVPVLEKTKKFEASELLPYVESLNSSASESEWRAKVESAKSELESRWNQEVDSEIQSIVDSEIRSDALNSNEEYKEADRAELNIQKETARSQWLFDVAQFLQAKLNEFLNLKSSEKENSITENKTELISSIDPNVEKITEHPQHIDRPSAGQATQSYYDGKNLWDSKWSDLLEKRNSWVIDSENILVNGFDEWNLSIQKLFTEKENYLNALNQREFQWRENGKIIEDRERVAREWMRSLVGNLRGQFGSLQGDENLTAAFGDMTNLLNRMDDALDNNLPLENLAREAALFFETQKTYAKIQENYWNRDDVKTKTGTQREDGLVFDTIVGRAIFIDKPFSCGGSICSNHLPEGWFQLDTVRASPGGLYLGNYWLFYLRMGGDLPASANFTVNVPEGMFNTEYSINFEFDLTKLSHWRKMRRAMEVNGDSIDLTDPNHRSVATSVTTPSNGTLLNQNTQLLYLDANGVERQLSIETGVDFDNLPAQRFTLKTSYTYTDNNAISNRDYWVSLGTEFNNWADKFTLAETALKNWSEKKNSYNGEFETKLADLNTLRDKATTEFDLRISSMISQRDEWLKNTYGYSLDPFSNEGDNPDSEYRRGVREWDEKVRAFQVAELGWFQNAKVVLENSVEDPVNGEKAFSETLENFTSGVQSNIVSSESNSDDLEKRAKSLTDAYYYRQAEELTKQEIANKNNEVSWNDYGSVLSADIKKSFERMEAYSKAEMDAMDRVNFLTASISPDVENLPYIEGDFTGFESDVSAFQEKQKFWQSEIDGSKTGSETGSAGFGFEKRKSAANLKLGELESFRADLAKAGDLKLEAMDTESGYLARMEEFFKKSEEFQSLSVKYESEGSFDEAKYYLKLSGDKLAEGKRILGEETEKLTTYLGEEVTIRTLNETRESFLNYIESLEAKTLVSSVTISAELKKNQEDKKSLEEREEEFTDAKEFLASARRIAALGEGFGENTKYFQARAAELMKRDLPKELLADLEDTLGEFDDWTSALVTRGDGKKQLEDAEVSFSGLKERIENFISDTSKYLINDTDVGNLFSTLENFGEGLNFAGNATLVKYADMIAMKLNDEAEQKNQEMQDNLYNDLVSASKFQYLRTAGFEFRKEDGFINVVRQIDSGDILIDGDTRLGTSYSSKKQYQNFSLQTKVNLPVLNINLLSVEELSTAGFSENLVEAFHDNLQNAEETYNSFLATFADKDTQISSIYTAMEEESDAYREAYVENQTDVQGKFSRLEQDFKNIFSSSTTNAKTQYEAGGFTFRVEGNDYKSDYEYKTIVMMPTKFGPMPTEVTNGMMHVKIRKDFDFNSLQFNFTRTGDGLKFVSSVFDEAYGKLNDYMKDAVMSKEDAPNPALTAILGMIGGTGSLGQRWTQYTRNTVESEVQRVAMNDPNIKALSSMTGVPVGVITSLGNQRFDKAVESYATSQFWQNLETQTGVKGLSAFAQNKIAERDALNAMRSSGAYNIGMFVGNTLSTIQYATSSAFNVTTTYLNAYSGGQLGNIAPDLFKINSAKDLMAENSRALSRSQSTAFHVAREWYRNRDVIDTAVTVAAVATSAITAGGSLAALAAYNAIEGAFDGGTMGAIAGAVSALASETGVSLDYTFEDGWSGSVGIKAGDFLTLSGGYSEENGWGAQAGIVVGDMNFGVGGTEGTGVNANIGFGFVENMNGNNMVNAGITFNENDGPGVSLTGNSDVGE
ncbi:MAG: TIGR04388 family protein, partial [Leptospiraceae bacterium]|nr:TIGR04388 family protein [Leptospiraceae bacterium]